MAELDINAPWRSYETLPNMRRDFDMNRDPYIKAQILDMEREDGQGETRTASQPKFYEPAPAPKPPVLPKESNWLLAQRDLVMAQAAYYHPQPHERSKSMETEKETNAPIQQFRDGAATIKLWENKVGDKTYVNASVGKLYKDKETDEWRESRSFNEQDLLKLQAMLPQVRQEMEKWQEYYRDHDQQKEQVQGLAHSAPESQPVQPQNDMVAARDAALSQAEPSQSSQGMAQSLTHGQSQAPSDGRSR